MPSAETRAELEGIKRDLKRYAFVLFGFVALIFAIELVDAVVLGGALDRFGVRPRSLPGLVGIVTHPFLHIGIGHVLSNALVILPLGWMIILREERHFWTVTALGILGGGLGIWLIGAGNSVHVGASGLAFAYFGYLLLTGWFDRRVLPVLLSIFVLFTWGYLIWGVLPGQVGISWEGHLFGFLFGVLAARLLRRR